MQNRILCRPNFKYFGLRRALRAVGNKAHHFVVSQLAAMLPAHRVNIWVFGGTQKLATLQQGLRNLSVELLV